MAEAESDNFHGYYVFIPLHLVAGFSVVLLAVGFMKRTLMLGERPFKASMQ
jgi:hypothetical protein